MLDKDVATGKVPANNYTSTGPKSSLDIKDKLSPPAPVQCYLFVFASLHTLRDIVLTFCHRWDIYASCSANQYAALANGTAEIDAGFNIVRPIGNYHPVGGTGGGEAPK